MKKRLPLYIALIISVFAMAACDGDELGKKEHQKPEKVYSFNYTGSINGRSYVDLGLSVKWATCNVGAETPDQPGLYVSWGSVKGATKDFTWENYTHGNGAVFSKYNFDPSMSQTGNPDNLYILESVDDLASVTFGKDWRIPTDEETTELRERCTFVWADCNGMEGYEVIGPNGNSIFLPAGGFYVDGNLALYGSNGCFWTSSLSTNNPIRAYELTYYRGAQIRGSSFRYYGENVRPVLAE